MFADQLKKWIADTLDLGLDHTFVVEHPADMLHGDYSTNVALIEAKKLGKNPKELAGEYVELLRKNIFENVEKIEIAGPGFINFYVKPEFFAKQVGEALEHKGFWGSNEILGRQKIIIEHTQPNPFKEFHIGHLMNNAIGESLVRIVKANGGEVKAASYHGDVGLHVAKAVWGLLKIKGERGNGAIYSVTIAELGQAYALGSAVFEKDEEIKHEIIEISKNIYNPNGGNIEVLNWYRAGKEASLQYFEGMYKRLDSDFNFHFYESESGQIGRRLVLENIGRVFEKGDDSAVIFRGENFDPKTHTRVFLNKDGLPTYEAKEVGLAEMKKEKFPYNQSITITGNEQDSFFKVCEVAIGEVFPELKGKLKHISHGMMRLPEGKMSSRTGNVITAESLIESVKEKILEKMSDREFSAEKKNAIAEIVAIGALKYSILRQATGKDIIFDFDKSLSFEGDSGPYLQYSYVRAESILRKAEEAHIEPQSQDRLGTERKVSTLEKLVARFGEIIEKSAEDFAPHIIATYLIELAAAFNNFYANEKIVDASDANSPYKIILTKAFAQTMKNGLHLLGIKVPEEM